ncbi:MAG: TonB-dependent receptor [Hellea sp.]|nr:TonB-dependent receptor [Hellea sp.]
MSKSKLKLRAGLLLSAGFAALTFTGTSFAQDVPEPPGSAETSTRVEGSGIDEIITTARKREESLQATPIAVSAFSGEDLIEAGLSNLSDLRNVVPNVDVQNGNGATGVGNIFIRGVGARNTGVNFDSGVGVYLDGIYMGRPDGTLLDNVDIANVQVLRGPQGTLFGKNTTGGAILYTSAAPSGEYEGNLQARVGNLGRFDMQGTLNIPISEGIIDSRFSAYVTTRDGFVENVFLDEMLSDENRWGGKARFLITLADDFNIDLNANYSKTDQAGRGQDCEYFPNAEGAGWQADAQNSTVFIPGTGQAIEDHCLDNNALGPDKVLSDLEGSRYEAETQGLSATVNWDINETFSLKTITALRDTDGADGIDLDGVAIPSLHQITLGQDRGGAKRETRQISQEVTLTAIVIDDALDLVAGGYVFSEESDGSTNLGVLGPIFGVAGLAPITFYSSSPLTRATDNKAYSAFTQADWKVNDQWSVTAGLRFTTENRQLRRIQDVLNPANLTLDGRTARELVGGNVWIIPGGEANFNPDHGHIHVVSPNTAEGITDVNDQTLQVKNHAWTPMISVQRKLDDVGGIDDGIIYGTISNGFLSGGVSESLDPVTQALTTYEPENVWNYEVGLKMDLLDRRLRMNTALYYTQYDDRQLTTVTVNPQTGSVAPGLINAAESVVKGVELETIFIPVDNLELTFNAAFNDGDIKEYTDTRILTPGSGQAGCTLVTSSAGPVDLCDVDRSDENLPRLPTEVFFGAVQYSYPTEIGMFIPRVQYSLRNNIEQCFDRGSCLDGRYRTDQDDLSARLTWISNKEDLRLTAFVNNLTDSRYIIGGTPLVDVVRTGGTVYNVPRTYGLELSADF